VAVGNGGPDRGDLLIRRHDAGPEAVNAQLCFSLPERALGPGQRQLQFTRVELYQNLARAHFLAQFRSDACNDDSHLPADADLVRRDKSSSEIHQALNRNPLHRNSAHLNGLTTTTTTTAALP